MRNLLRFALLCAVVTAPLQARAEGEFGQTLALIVGWNGGGFGLAPLRYADDDALRFASALSAEASGGVPAKVVVLTQADADTRAHATNTQIIAGRPTRARLQTALQDFARVLGASPKRHRVFVIYAGHGLTNRLLLAPSQEQPPQEQPPENQHETFSGYELRAAITKLAQANARAEIFVFIDACRSQSLFTTRGGLDGPDLSAVIDHLEQQPLGPRVGVLTAATSAKPAGELQRLHSGYFSHVVLSGIVGAADADEDQQVSFGELAAFVSFHTQAMMGQRPWFSAPGGNLTSVLFDHSQDTHRMVFPRGLDGHFEVRAAQGRPLFAELFKSKHQRVSLSLPQGQYTVLQNSMGQGARQVQVNLPAAGTVDLQTSPWQVAAQVGRGDGADENSVDDGAADQDALGFRAPFSSDVVATLKSGYESGRSAPVTGVDEAQHVFATSIIGGTTPLSLGGASYGFGLSYRRLFSHWFIGASGSVLRASHELPDGAYTLLQVPLQAQLGGWHAWAGWLLAAWLGAGSNSLWRMAEQTTGDRLLPRASAGLALHRRLYGRWFLGVAPLVHRQWVDVDGRSTVDTGMTINLEVSHVQ